MGNEDVNLSVDHLLRHESGRIVAVLTRIFGFDQIDRIEDAVQEAFLKALNTWPYKGIPENSTAWLIQVAKNHLLDLYRKENRSVEFDERTREVEDTGTGRPEQVYFEDEISEDQLRMIFACCHPSIPQKSQIALTLKTVGGFNNREIARALLVKKSAIDKTLVRAKKRLKNRRERFEIPSPDLLPARLDAVLSILYLMFNEGYLASEGDDLIRQDLCHEAIRLVSLLTSHRVTNLPRTNALAALMYFQGSRLGARSHDNGLPTILSEQDRKKWDMEMIATGAIYLKASAKGNELHEYHLEAEIASHHAIADSFESTDWAAINECYQKLYEKRPSPIVAVNKAFATGRVRGADAALEELRAIDIALVEDYYPFYIVMADLQAQSGAKKAAVESYQRALELISNRSVRSFVEEKILLLVPVQAGIH